MKILLVEDEPKVSAFIKKGLEEQTFEVEVAYDGLMGKRLAENNIYNLIILDVILPHLTGVEVCKKLREGGNQTPILMLTALSKSDDVVTGLDAGADDYLSKPFKFNELMARIRALTRRKNHTADTTKLLLSDLEMDTDTKTVKRADKVIQLTAREFALLEYFMRHQRRVLSRIDIAENVWDISFDTGTNVVDVYVNYLRNKIDKGFETKLLHTVVGMGYVLKKED